MVVHPTVSCFHESQDVSRVHAGVELVRSVQ